MGPSAIPDCRCASFDKTFGTLLPFAFVIAHNVFDAAIYRGVGGKKEKAPKTNESAPLFVCGVLFEIRRARRLKRSLRALSTSATAA